MAPTTRTGPDALRRKRKQRQAAGTQDSSVATGPRIIATSKPQPADQSRAVRGNARRFRASTWIWRATFGRVWTRLRRARRRTKILLAVAVVVLLALAGLSLDEQQRSELDGLWWFDQGGVTTPVGYQQTMKAQAPWAASVFDPDSPPLAHLVAAATDAWGPMLQDRCTSEEHGVWLPWLKGEKASACSNDTVSHHAQRMAWDVEAYAAITAARICARPRQTANWKPVVEQYQALGADVTDIAAAITALEVEIRTSAKDRADQPCTASGVPALAKALGISLS